MKKFVLLILFVSVFVIGLESIFEKASAKFNSDEKAVQLINLARIAIGGNENIKNVRALTIVGTTSNYFEKEGVQNFEQGSLEINLEMPNRFSKNIRIGNPGESTGDFKFENDVVIKKGGENVEFTAKDSGEEKKGVFVFKRDDGTVEEVKTDGKHKIIIRKDENGKVLTEDIVGQEIVVDKNKGKSAAWTTDDGKRIIIDKDVKSGHFKMRNNEMVRVTMALLLTPPDNLNVSYKYLGQGNTDGYNTNIINVESDGGSFKLHLDAATNLPRMISYFAKPHVALHFKNTSKEEVYEFKSDLANVEPVEHQIRFLDYRAAGNVLFPYNWKEFAGGKQTQDVFVTKYEVNPENIADKFKDQNVFIRKIKPKNGN